MKTQLQQIFQRHIHEANLPFYHMMDDIKLLTHDTQIHAFMLLMPNSLFHLSGEAEVVWTRLWTLQTRQHFYSILLSNFGLGEMQPQWLFEVLLHLHFS